MRPKKIAITLSTEELETIRELAWRARLSMASYIRQQVLPARIPDRPEAEPMPKVSMSRERPTPVEALLASRQVVGK